MTVSPHSRVSVPANILVSVVADETVLLNLESERYFGLDSMGTTIWTTLLAAPSIGDACVQLVERFDVNPDTLSRDVDDLVAALLEHGLLQCHE
jgi:Coenzyme PQQ synthesis protein D (PqqD)